MEFEKIEQKTSKGVLRVVHIADIHFGAFDPKDQFRILKEQFLDQIERMPYDVLVLNGDTYDHKCMSSSDIALYASLFVRACVDDCRRKNATLIINSGTESHDANQLKQFYHYLEDKTVHVEIVEQIKAIYTHGAKIICIPEKYNMGAQYYQDYLIENGTYDLCLVHGMYKGAVYQQDSNDLNSVKAPTFEYGDFRMCSGPVLFGHVHTPGCFNSHVYYSGSPLRWCFGEEQQKGFLYVAIDMDSKMYYPYFWPIESYKYSTINLDDMIHQDPNQVIEYIKSLQDSGIHHLRLEFTKDMYQNELDNLNLLKNFYKDNNLVKIKADILRKSGFDIKEYEEKAAQYSYLTDKSLNEYQIFTRYLNEQKGYEYITTDELLKILKGED